MIDEFFRVGADYSSLVEEAFDAGVHGSCTALREAPQGSRTIMEEIRSSLGKVDSKCTHLVMLLLTPARSHPLMQDTPLCKGETLLLGLLRAKYILYGKSLYDHGIFHQI